MSERKSAIICPKCGKLISWNSEQCFHCGYKQPGRWLFLNKFSHLDVITLVISLSAVLYVMSLLLDLSALFKSFNPLTLFSPTPLSIYRLGATGTIAIANGRWWTIFTAIFLHGGLLHIFFNMMWVRQIGPGVERFFGLYRFVIIFLLSGAIGFVGSVLAGHQLTIGASGSIFGLLGALVYYGRSRGGHFGESIYRQTLYWAGMMFVFGFLMRGVDNFAHGGGFVGGYLVAMWVGYFEKNNEQLWHKILALVLVGVTVLGFFLSFFSSI